MAIIFKNGKLKLSLQKDWCIYGVYTSLSAFLIGLYAYTIPMAAEHIYFFLAAPIAAFFTYGLIWYWTFRSTVDFKIGNVISVGIIGTLICHYLTFVLLGVGRIVVYYLTELFSNHAVEPDSILEVLSMSFIQSLLSVYLIGIITMPLSILIGLIVRKKTILKNKATQH